MRNLYEDAEDEDADICGRIGQVPIDRGDNLIAEDVLSDVTRDGLLPTERRRTNIPSSTPVHRYE